MIQTTTLKDVQVAWNIFNKLPVPFCWEGGRGGSPEAHYKAREDAWRDYTKVRDHYLYVVGRVSLTELNSIWYPKMTAYENSLSQAVN